MGTRIDARERFELLFAAHYGDVLRYVQRRVDRGDAADVAAEVFVVVWRRIDDVPGHALPWLYGVARRTCANQRRGAERRLRLVERVAVAAGNGGTASFAAIGAPSQSSLAEAFDRLADADREILALIAWEGLGARDASVVLDCSVAAVTMRLHRARRRLRALLDEIEKEQ